MKPVLYRDSDSESVIKAMEGYTPGEGWEPLYDQAAIDADIAAARDHIDKVESEVAALKAERDALLKDAERYRWLAANGLRWSRTA